MSSPPTGLGLFVGTTVFAANAGLLILQLLAGKFLAPFVGSSLETWTSVIAVFLAGIALGNAYGGKRADANPSPKRLAAVLLFGAIAAAWTALFPLLLHATEIDSPLPLGVRIPVLTFLLCFPAGFTLSLLTPLAIRIALPDVTKAGRVSGRVFALGTLGCLVGNYVTGFYLLAVLPIDRIAFGVAGVLLLLAGVAGGMYRDGSFGSGSPRTAIPDLKTTIPLSKAYAVVFLCSFAAMALELTATRILAQVFGVSLFTWTGVIGVMLAGTAVGNWAGGRWAGPDALPRGLVAAAGSAALVVVLYILAVRVDFFPTGDIQLRIVAWSFLLFFLPMALLGTVSPRVIRWATPDVASAGRVAGRVYAWSTAGAIAGTVATGYLLISHIGMTRVVLLAALLPAAATLLVTPVFKRVSLLYPLCIISGAAVAGLYAFSPEVTQVTKETNYYAIRVRPAKDDSGEVVPNQLTMQLDSLVHSRVDLKDPTFLHYKHEKVQLDFLRAVRDRVPNPKVLVIGGGGYTFPRCAKTLFPTCSVDVVEIDPGVTQVSYENLGLDPALGIVSHHMDGRQFVADKAVAGAYDLITLDAVNDLSVPAHLLTVEFDRAVRRCLAPGGVYLVSVIDVPKDGVLWGSVARTLREVFPHVEVLTGDETRKPEEQAVLILYASDEPLDWETLTRAGATHTRRLPPGTVSHIARPVVLTDRFAPVDQLMIEVFRRRKFER